MLRCRWWNVIKNVHIIITIIKYKVYADGGNLYIFSFIITL